MGTPHKHAELIKAWADGAVIQYKQPLLGWRSVLHPSWSPNIEYRTKPTGITLKYRRYAAVVCEEPRVLCFRGDCGVDPEACDNFIAWIDADWVTSTVEQPLKS